MALSSGGPNTPGRDDHGVAGDRRAPRLLKPLSDLIRQVHGLDTRLTGRDAGIVEGSHERSSQLACGIRRTLEVIRPVADHSRTALTHISQVEVGYDEYCLRRA